MKWLRLAAALVALGPACALAFHEGGVGACEGCHSAHLQPDSPAKNGPNLLVGSDPSSTCLVCHASPTQGSYQVLTTNINSPQQTPLQYTPGGDFAWLLRSYVWNEGGTVQQSDGERHGHSIVAQDFGLFADSKLTTAPGGSYPSSQLSCISCHDPHGQYRINSDATVSRTGKPTTGSGSYGGAALALPTAQTAVGTYRLLAGAGYAPRSAGPVVPFVAGPPIAAAPAAYNQGERVTDVRVAYGRGMSEWCGNCHGEIHTAYQSNTASTFQHAAGATARLATAGEQNIYNAYVQTGKLDGSQWSSYTSMVPYEEGIGDRPTLATRAVSDGSQKAGPFSGNETVMCLTCHRAHATAWDHATRWNMPASGTIVFGGQWPGIDTTGQAALPANAQGRTKAETRAAMYDRDPGAYAAFQRVLCNKCHAKD
jgi:hypothetical protein